MKLFAQNTRRNYERMKSRHPRLALGYHRCAVLYRRTEEHLSQGPGCYRLERHAWKALRRSWDRLWETDPTVFHRSPLVARDEDRRVNPTSSHVEVTRSSDPITIISVDI